ncbi:hypothetical protein MS6015_38570 [Klebsiella pneumoniae]|nr:hypothetical protein MS6015_38570 [Klebsiella pneumoniae]
MRFKDHFGRYRGGGFHHAAQIFAHIVIIAGEHFADIHDHIHFPSAVGNQLPHFLNLGIGGMPTAGKADRTANHHLSRTLLRQQRTEKARPARQYVDGNNVVSGSQLGAGANIRFGTGGLNCAQIN